MEGQRAFSLTAILLALTLVMIIGVIAAPGLQNLWERNQQHRLCRQVLRTLRLARSHAIIQGVSVEVCASNDGLICSSNWPSGWLIREVDSLKLITFIQPNHNPHLYWRGFQTRIVFHSNGTSPLSNGRFFSCSQQLISWQIILNRQGRLRTASSHENSLSKHDCN